MTQTDKVDYATKKYTLEITRQQYSDLIQALTSATANVAFFPMLLLYQSLDNLVNADIEKEKAERKAEREAEAKNSEVTKPELATANGASTKKVNRKSAGK